MAGIHIPDPLYFSSSRDVSVNLALEEALMAEVLPGRRILFFYENDTAVVIGRFQNPWHECRTGLVRRLGIPLCRRISGGGTVVHGAGNLNIAVISGEAEVEKEENLDHIIAGCAEFGLKLRRNTRHDLCVTDTSGKVCKVSGSAFRQTSRASLHHCTLLVDADLQLVRQLLNQRSRYIESRGVRSVSSPVTNLSELAGTPDLPSLAAAIAGTWYGDPDLSELKVLNFSDNPVFTAALERLGSDEWTWQKTPAFQETFTGLSGRGQLILEVKGGKIVRVPSASFLSGADYHGPSIREHAGSGAPGWVGELARRVDGD